MNDAAAALRAHGYRSTVARQLVLDAVVDLRHATPEQILDRVHTVSPAINLSTVYRVLEVLSEVGLVRHAHLGTGSPTYHAADQPAHLHFCCTDCGRVQSLPPDVADDLIADVYERIGFRADVTHSGISGVCAHCQGAAPDPTG